MASAYAALRNPVSRTLPMLRPLLLFVCGPLAAPAGRVPLTTPWLPPPADSPALLPFLRDTSRPKLAYSTWVGWYQDGGLNESVLEAQVEAMSTKLRPYGWTHILHDYGWANNDAGGDVFVDRYGRLYPSWQRYPSTAVKCSTDCRTGCSSDCRDHTWGTWKPFSCPAHRRLRRNGGPCTCKIPQAIKCRGFKGCTPAWMNSHKYVC